MNTQKLLSPMTRALSLLTLLLLLPSAGTFAATAQVPAAQQWLDYGRRQTTAQQYPQAIESLNKALALDTELPGLHKALGNAHYYSGDLPEALRHYETAAQQDPNDKALAEFLQRLKLSAPRSQRYNRWVPMGLSALLPGAGQFYNGRPIRGLIFGGITLGMAGGMFEAYLSGSSAMKEYENLPSGSSQAEFERAYSKAQDASSRGGIFGPLFVVCYIATIVDAGFTARPMTTAYTPEASFDLAWSPDGVRGKLRLLEF